MLASTDPLPSRKSGKKKDKLGKRIYKEPESDAGEITPIVDLPSLVSQIRVFLADLGGSQSMVLPPMDKESRARVHVIATCFKLKSKSAGVGSARHTTLIRTTKSGVKVDEKKINYVLSGRSFGPSIPFSKAHDRRSGEGSQGIFRHRDGDVVGSKAAKIGESNVGFRLLRQMGYALFHSFLVKGELIHAHLAVLVAGARANALVSQVG
jgi:R3H domain